MRIITDKDVLSKSDECDCDCDCACTRPDAKRPTEYYVLYGGTCMHCGTYTCKYLLVGQGRVEEICKNCGREVTLVEGN